jgi:ligand-binding SRPBCC domain-containing protein
VPAVIEVVTVIEAPATIVFDLELDVDVHADSMARSGETAVTADGRRRLGLGDEVTFRARHFGVRWRMTSRISVHERPGHFVDEQTRGPFREMRHEHWFEDLGDGRTRMIDRMTIRAPGGPLGAVVARTLLTPYLKRLLIRRASHIRDLAEAAGRRQP